MKQRFQFAKNALQADSLLVHYDSNKPLITPHAQRERGKVIGRGVHIYIYIYIYMSVVEKKILIVL